MEFVKSVWYTLIAYGLILIGAVVAAYHLLTRPVVLGIVAGFAITGGVMFAVRKVLLKGEK